jgi:hypothetical protein
MFMLEFFKIVSAICDAAECMGIHVPDEHASILKRKERTGTVAPNPNRALIDYVQRTYPAYFKIKRIFSKHMTLRRNRMLSDPNEKLSFE